MQQNNNLSLKVLISYHKPSTLIKNNIFIPIHVGRALKDKESKDGKTNLDEYNWMLDNMIGDNTGDNISDKNREYCELTSVYWAWKNYEKIDNPDYVGFMQYRRLLDISYNHVPEISLFNNEISNLLGYEDSNINNLFHYVDIILPEIYNVHPWGLPEEIMSSYDFYCRSHIKEDIDKVINIINTDYPDYKIDMDNYLNGTRSFFFNIFIMKKEIFFQYCEWLFPILDKYCLVRGNRENIDVHQNREIGYIAERLLNIFINHYIRVNENSRITHRNIVSMINKIDEFKMDKVVLGNKDLSKIKKQVIDNNPEQIYIVYSTDNNYVQHCSASIASILLNSDEKSYFNFIILDGGISEKNKNNLLCMKNIKECNITFYDMSEFDFSYFKLNREYISVSTYYRLVLPKILPNNIGKVIYIDCDTIVETNIKKLWNINIENYSALAVDDECGVSQCRRLGLPIQNRYFNAGLLVLNINKLREYDFFDECVKTYKEKKNIITLQDQDILNIVLNKKVKFIDLNWNTNSRVYLGNNLKGYDIPYFESSYTKKDVDNAKYNPYILHYTDSLKPWHIYCNHPLRYEYLKYLKFTKFNMFRLKFFFDNYIFSCIKMNNFLKIKFCAINISIKMK